MPLFTGHLKLTHEVVMVPKVHAEFWYADAQCRLAVMHLLWEQSYAVSAHQVQIDLEDVGL